MKNSSTGVFIICTLTLCLAILSHSCTPVEKLKYVADVTSSSSVKNDFYNDRSEKQYNLTIICISDLQSG
jgi:hypothetical protein